MSKLTDKQTQAGKLLPHCDRFLLGLLFNLTVETIYSETSNCLKTTRRCNPEVGAFYSHRRETLKTKILNLILPTTLGPGVHSASNRNEYQKQKRMFLRSKGRPVRTADNLTDICEPTV
jgi:hypothetical protein